MNPLSVIADLEPGAEDALRPVFRAIEEDQAGNPYVQFPRSRLTHFARWIFLRDDEYGTRLLFAADHDGDVDTYLRELEQISPDLDAVWGQCVGYTGRAGFRAFICRQMQRNRAVYVGFPDVSLATILTQREIRQRLERLLEPPQVANDLTGDAVREILRGLTTVDHGSAFWGRVRRKVRGRLGRVARAVNDEVMADLLVFSEWFTRLGRDPNFSRLGTVCGPGDGSLPPPDLDNQIASIGTQSSFMVYAKIKPGCLLRIRFSLAVAALIALFGYPVGNFANVYTIHSYRWMIIDRGHRLIFMSTFDGTWENYMGDFIDNLTWALDAIYSNTEGYPPGGMQQIYLFKQWIRDHQPVPSVVYNAYPDETVLTLLRDRAISHELVSGGGPESVSRLLALL